MLSPPLQSESKSASTKAIANESKLAIVQHLSKNTSKLKFQLLVKEPVVHVMIQGLFLYRMATPFVNIFRDYGPCVCPGAQIACD